MRLGVAALFAVFTTILFVNFTLAETAPRNERPSLTAS